MKYILRITLYPFWVIAHLLWDFNLKELKWRYSYERWQIHRPDFLGRVYNLSQKEH